MAEEEAEEKQLTVHLAESNARTLEAIFPPRLLTPTTTDDTLGRKRLKEEPNGPPERSALHFMPAFPAVRAASARKEGDLNSRKCYELGLGYGRLKHGSVMGSWLCLLPLTVVP